MNIHEIMNWKLVAGSNRYPSRQGETCINEAAIVVAGLDYRPVKSINDLPSCFSRVIGAYLLRLNDDLDNESRQKLIEFAPRLSGSADTEEVEKNRLEYIIVQTVRRIISMAMDAYNLRYHAAKCRMVETLDEAKQVAADAGSAAKAVYAGYVASVTEEADATKADDAASVGKSARAIYAAYAAYAIEEASALRPTIADNAGIAASAVKNAKELYSATVFHAADATKVVHAENVAKAAKAAIDSHCIEIIRGALDIGNQAAPIEEELIVSRVAEIRKRCMV